MNIKLSRYSLSNSRYKNIIPGMRVASSNGVSNIGVIIAIGKIVKDYWKEDKPEDVTVLWGSGNKRGKFTKHDPENLIDVDAYINCIETHCDYLKTLQNAAKNVGL